MDNCCASIIKYLIFLFNLLFAISGLVLIGIGSYVYITAENFIIFLGSSYENTGIFLIVLGVVIFAIAFFGCCGAILENSCLIHTYAIILFVVVIAEIGTGIAAYVEKDKVRSTLNENMANGLNDYNTTSENVMTQSWDYVQENLKCCGVNNNTDWQELAFKSMPDSCCEGGMVKGCGTDGAVKKFTNGCLVILEKSFSEHIYYVAGVVAGIVVIQILYIIFAACVGRCIRRSSRQTYSYYNNTY